MADPTTFHFTLPANNRPALFRLNEEFHPDFNFLTTNRARARGGDIDNVLDTVVVHATAGFATQHAVDTWRTVRASAHWIIPDEDESEHGNFIWATVAERKAAFHVLDSINPGGTVLGGTRNINNRSLGIEIVNTQNVQNYTDAYSAWQVTMTARIVLYAWARYPNLRHIISHAKLDPNRRADPGRQFPWTSFRDQVLSHSALPAINAVTPAPLTAVLPPEAEGAPGGCTP
jgi:N-acetylmuramoyl-L-alanine amidase